MPPPAALLFLLTLLPGLAPAQPLTYTRTDPPLEVTFTVAGGHYSGAVTGGNLFLQPDIAAAPTVRWSQAAPGKFYTLMMLDFDGDAAGSWPDAVPSGGNSPVRHWIVGNIPGALLRAAGYVEAIPASPAVTVLQAYRAPHIPMVSDRYGLYLFEQAGRLDFTEIAGPITNYDVGTFLQAYKLGAPAAANFFVAIYTSVSPFSGRPFHGNDVSATWHRDLGKGRLTP